MTHLRKHSQKSSISYRTTFAFCITLSLVGCDILNPKVTAKEIKSNLIKTCGKTDSSCISDVENQFPFCNQRYQNDWRLYLKANIQNQERFLQSYLDNLYSCIVDEKGNAYFSTVELP
ncbi:hypothetical protein [Pleionea litopenaei]|uniref:Lipoprotein n=1 Tax=Pleionea litopenaei TaxID=3070815 RepID=A0AA51X5B0_9GAMM|nr:hypothetical protein [Pleionea sp. HL-JVS1]WMS85673.1 hypothetical protein Q9312_10650 [Pleionea sp. HL-JVS1]